MGTAGKAVSAGHTQQRHIAIVPHTHWDREWYEPYQSFRLRLVKMLDGLIPLLEARPVVRQVPPRRADGGGGRLSRGPARERGAHPRPGRGGPAVDGPVVHPHGRVPRVGRDHRAGPPERDAARRRLRRGHGGRVPARHVRPHRADAPDPASGGVRARRGVAGRALGHPPAPDSCGRRPTGRRCAPSTCPPATATAPRSPTTPRLWCAGSPTTRRRSATSYSTACCS